MERACTSAAVQVGVECDVFGGSYVWLMPVMGAGVKSAEAEKKDAEEVREREGGTCRARAAWHVRVGHVGCMAQRRARDHHMIHLRAWGHECRVGCRAPTCIYVQSPTVHEGIMSHLLYRSTLNTLSTQSRRTYKSWHALLPLMLRCASVHQAPQRQALAELHTLWGDQDELRGGS